MNGVDFLVQQGDPKPDLPRWPFVVPLVLFLACLAPARDLAQEMTRWGLEHANVAVVSCATYCKKQNDPGGHYQGRRICWCWGGPEEPLPSPEEE